MNMVTVNMLRYDLVTILSFTVVLATFFNINHILNIAIKNLLPKFHPYLSSHSLAITRQKYGMLSCMEISHSFDILFKALPLARK